MRNILARILILILLLTSCQSRTVEHTTSTPQPTETITATATTVHDSLNTAEAKIKIAHSAPAKTPQRTPVATKTSTPTPTQPAPTSLNSDGPWYLFRRIYWSDDKRYSNVLLADFDSSTFTVPNLPPIPLEEKEWTYQVAPSGGLIAFRTSVDNRYPFFVTLNGVDDQIFIVKLPENRVIAILPLLGKAAWDQAQKDLAGETISSTTLGIIGDPGSFMWSPDGRYLVYSAAVEGVGADLYSYDAQTGEVERLTDGQKNSMIWEWLPDGSEFFYRDVLTYDLDYPVFYNTYSGVYLYMDTGSSRQLYVPKGGETIQWIGENNAIVYEIGLEGSKRNLRELNIVSWKSSVIYEENFTGIHPIIGAREILLNLSSNAYLLFEDGGIFRVNLDTKQMEKVVSCAFCYVRWIGKEKKFIVEQWDTDTNKVSYVFYTIAGKEAGRIETTNNGYINVSQDEQWAVTDWEKPLIIHLEDLEHHDLVPIGEEITQTWWDEDQIAFTSLQNHFSDTNNTYIVRYSEASGWDPELIIGVPNLYDGVYVIQP